MGNRRDILEEAADLVEGDRNAQYGDPNQDFLRTATMWSVYIHGVMERKGPGYPPELLDPWDVAWMMILLKASRSTVSPGKRDHYADAAGYAACGYDTTCAPGLDIEESAVSSREHISTFTDEDLIREVIIRISESDDFTEALRDDIEDFVSHRSEVGLQ